MRAASNLGRPQTNARQASAVPSEPEKDRRQSADGRQCRARL